MSCALPNIITPSTKICSKHQMNVVLGLIFGYETRFDVRYDLMFPSKHHNNTISLSNSYPLTFIKMSDAHLKYQVDVQIICASASDLILIYSVDCTVNIYLLIISPMHWCTMRRTKSDFCHLQQSF